jgi:uncharacterized protein YxjI
VKARHSHLGVGKVCHPTISHLTLVITDPNGQLLFQLTNKMFSFQPTYEAEDANGQPLFMVRKRFGCMSHPSSLVGILMIVSTKMEATFRNHSTGQETIIDLNGDFWGGAADLSIQGGPVIAQITRDAFSAREIFSNSQQVCLLDTDRGELG